MGVKNLWDILESCKQTLPLHHLQNKRVCVDLSCWLVQLHTAGHRPPGACDKLYLRNLFHRLRALIALNCSLILVADGSVPSIKLSTYRRRLGAGSEVAQVEENLQGRPSVSLRRNRGSQFSCMIKEAKVLGRALGIPCLDGLEEAEAQCALLNAEFLCDGCFTSDSDIFLFGARTVYRDIFLGESGYVTCYEMEDIEQKLGFGRNSLISLALLLGSDYSHGLNGFGRETACQIVKSLGENAVLHHIISEGLTIAKKYKGKRKTVKNVSSDANKENEQCQQPKVCADHQNGGSRDEYLQVIDAYLKPKCHSADSEIVKRACVQHPFLRSQLHEVCEQHFGWSPEKTDQYILPKIAERDLRRFTNLRTMLSESELIAPLHKIPITCPVSAIIKERKIQGQEFYEVSWQEFDGIQSSLVPVSLVESACPEKIVEFMEKKAEGRKQNRRPGKTNKAAVNAVDRQLQELLLSIDPQSCGTSISSINVGPSYGSPPQNRRIRETTKASEKAERQNIEVDLPPQCLLHSIESQNRLIPPTSKSLRSSSSNILPSEVIDPPVTSDGVQPTDGIPWHNRKTGKSAKAFEMEDMLNLELNFELRSPAIPPASKSVQSAGAHTLNSDIIDLCSPSPPLNVCKVGKGQKIIHQHVDVIDIYESENDVTPDHEKRVRELRLFIDSIRDDLY